MVMDGPSVIVLIVDGVVFTYVGTPSEGIVMTLMETPRVVGAGSVWLGFVDWPVSLAPPTGPTAFG